MQAWEGRTIFTHPLQHCAGLGVLNVVWVVVGYGRAQRHRSRGSKKKKKKKREKREKKERKLKSRCAACCGGLVLMGECGDVFFLNWKKTGQ
jgi:aryl-alcohol dehydrogenase-like predicted oxidoreductase